MKPTATSALVSPFSSSHHCSHLHLTMEVSSPLGGLCGASAGIRLEDRGLALVVDCSSPCPIEGAAVTLGYRSSPELRFRGWEWTRRQRDLVVSEARSTNNLTFGKYILTSWVSSLLPFPPLLPQTNQSAITHSPTAHKSPSLPPKTSPPFPRSSTAAMPTLKSPPRPPSRQ